MKATWDNKKVFKSLKIMKGDVLWQCYLSKADGGKWYLSFNDRFNP